MPAVMFSLLFLFHTFCLSSSRVVNGKWVDEVQSEVVLITGCSSGIGRATALEFARKTDKNGDKKFKVWATMRNTTAWEGQAVPQNVVLLPMDVTSDESVLKAVENILSVDRRIDILVNNAGYGLVGPLETVHISEAKDMFDVNVWGVVRVLQTVLPSMRNARKGHVISISSTSGIRATPANEFYAGSKFALEGITEAMRYTLAAFNISVTNVNPGPVRTEFTNRYGNPDAGGRGTRKVQDKTGYLNVAADNAVSRLKSRMSSLEAQTSDEVARVVVNVAYIGMEARKITDVPFSVGSNQKTQATINQVRKNPTGWGGVYTDMLLTQPSLDDHTAKLQSKHEDVHGEL